MFKNISILGSTGSIGTQTLEVCRKFGIKISGLSAGGNTELLIKQILEFKPQYASVSSRVDAALLESRVKGSGTEIFWGDEGLKRIATAEKAECVVSAIVGIAGLVPTYEAILAGKHIALANKEVLVTAGSIILDEIKKRKLLLLPIDSEHSAIFQCLMGNSSETVSKIILTASGGPFRDLSLHELQAVTPEMALRHPNWDMGSKITIDSATLMNKGLEVIEAKWLFDIEPEKIEVVVHPQSIVHSMVEYIDSSVVAQLGLPDMKLPIQFALTYPARLQGDLPKLDLMKVGRLDFLKPDTERFRCLQLAYEAIKIGKTMPAALNGANEIAVKLFLEKKISFFEIAKLVEGVMSRHNPIDNPTLEAVLYTDDEARKLSMEVLA